MDPRVSHAHFEVPDKEYPGMLKHLSEFQVKLAKSVAIGVVSAGTEDPLGPSITVFKRKNLKKFRRKDHPHNIYDHNSNSPLDLNEYGKSTVSCIRCRKLKKKCTRSVPECSNCMSSDELCVYVPRKSKHKDKLTVRTGSTGSLPEISQSEWDFDKKKPTHKRLSLPLIQSGLVKREFDPVQHYNPQDNSKLATPEETNYYYGTKRNLAHDFAIILN
ncbi:uncharacterized protein CANTADRAFT_5273 [Suhomyces tanzawaensis NRRL Y-17324]|uniref:Zn(2)-C6 fungal-type domain-containing protein n=1 Tax=Suhomyces tanzawaensis NRRL Y-17324 TaxID=984487 RepID=A0A1E4SJC3_9ASCO|nr:uncharacterized protein CANTADRAFT_5273 [Suhomyces tanzawaensis NRRL Y-17324]ODV79537.1 hypothetical protein CANTADRAFT_5273 [Suhomyces tanzawaensis NRRL Y-17324]